MRQISDERGPLAALGGYPFAVPIRSGLDAAFALDGSPAGPAPAAASGDATRD